MKIYNLGNQAFNNYLLDFEFGAVLIDAGNQCTYEKFLEKLKTLNFNVEKINYIVLTHAHSDHISYLYELLKNNNITLIAGADAVKNILYGKDKISAFSSRLSRALSKLTTALNITPKTWKSFDVTEFKTILIEGENDEILKEYGLSIFPFKGHTLDSIGIISDEKQAFVGDHIMSLFPAKNSVPLLIEDLDEYKKSYENLIKLSPRVIYVGHGKPKTFDFILKNEKYVRELSIFVNK